MRTGLSVAPTPPLMINYYSCLSVCFIIISIILYDLELEPEITRAHQHSTTSEQCIVSLISILISLFHFLALLFLRVSLFGRVLIAPF